MFVIRTLVERSGVKRQRSRFWYGSVCQFHARKYYKVISFASWTTSLYVISPISNVNTQYSVGSQERNLPSTINASRNVRVVHVTSDTSPTRKSSLRCWTALVPHNWTLCQHEPQISRYVRDAPAAKRHSEDTFWCGAACQFRGSTTK
jgi:hypothetical protein